MNAALENMPRFMAIVEEHQRQVAEQAQREAAVIEDATAPTVTGADGDKKPEDETPPEGGHPSDNEQEPGGQDAEP